MKKVINTNYHGWVCKSLEKLEIRKDKSDKALSREVYRKYTGKLKWLASNGRPYLSVYVMNCARKHKNSTQKN